MGVIIEYLKTVKFHEISSPELHIPIAIAPERIMTVKAKKTKYSQRIFTLLLATAKSSASFLAVCRGRSSLIRSIGSETLLLSLTQYSFAFL